MAKALLISGAGRYSDPWHPFAETSAEVAQILRDEGHVVEVSEDVEERLADLSGVDLLVVNVGNPTRHGLDSPTIAAARDGLIAYRARGGGLLSLHVSAGSFPNVPEWAEFMGGRWVQGITMHPDIGEGRIEIIPTEHPVTAGVESFDTIDERYSYLELAGDVVPLAHHHHDDIWHPMLWARETAEGGRVVYDALGHNATAYATPQTRQLIAQAASWIIG
jgi:type 1 glutamine amidotransferase